MSKEYDPLHIRPRVFWIFVAFIACAALIVRNFAPVRHLRVLEHPTSEGQWSGNMNWILSDIPLLHAVKKATWTTELADDRSGGLIPGPSACYTIGFAELDSKSTKRICELGLDNKPPILVSRYQAHFATIWNNTQNTAWQHANGAGDEIVNTTKYRGADVYIDQQNNIIFFRLLVD